MKRRLRAMTGLLLATAMLLCSIAPPDFRHAHAGGDANHQHDVNHSHNGRGSRYHSHTRDTSLQHHRHDDHPHSHASVLQPAPMAHVHRSFALFDLALPIPIGSDSDQPDTNTANDIYAVRLIDDYLPTWRAGVDNHWITAPLSLRVKTVATEPSLQRAFVPSRTRILLCDTARHERSGVQLF